MEKITYRRSKDFTDSELIEYLTSSCSRVGDEEAAQERVRQVREYTEKLLEKEEKSKNIEKFKSFRKPNLMRFYEEVVDFCKTKNCYCPFLLFQDVESPSADYGFLIIHQKMIWISLKWITSCMWPAMNQEYTVHPASRASYVIYCKKNYFYP